MGDIVTRQVTPRFDTLERDMMQLRAMVEGHDSRISRLEGVEAGKLAMLDQMRDKK
jgi:hypothetical protein